MNSALRALLAAALAATLVSTGVAAAKAPKRPDLVVQAVKAAGAAHPGSLMTLGDTTLNKGPGGAKKSVTALFLSKDAKRDPGDRRLMRHKLGKLGAGKGSTGVKQVKLPNPLAAGTYRLIACADSPGAIAEKREKNNCAVRALTVTPSPSPPPPGRRARSCSTSRTSSRATRCAPPRPARRHRSTTRPRPRASGRAT
jgi:hypothetical protein